MIKPTQKIPVNNDSGRKPFFIIGSGRSGNTLLRRVLNNHTDLFIPPETYVLGEIIKNYYKNPLFDWSELVDKTLSTFEADPEFWTFKLKSLGNLKEKLTRIDEKERSLATIISGFYEYYKTTHMITGNTWGDKTPLNVFCLDELYSVFPGAKFIHIIRDPFDAISSYLNSGIYLNVTDAAERWVRSVELSCAFGKKHPRQYIEIHYSELVSNTTDASIKLCDFLSIEFQEDMLGINNDDLGDVNIHAHHANVTNEINTKSIGKGLIELNDDEKKSIFKCLLKSRNQVITDFLEYHMILKSPTIPLQQYIQNKKNVISQLDKQLRDINNSFSYKSGRIISTPLRLILRLPNIIPLITHRAELLANKNKRLLMDKGVFFIDKKEIRKHSKQLRKQPHLSSKKHPKLIVSLTSFPDRIPDIFYNIYSLLNQTKKPDMLILWLAEEQFENKEGDLPKELLDMRENGLIIKWCSDLKSYKKLFFSLQEFPEDIIVTADDDLYYPKNWLELLHSSYLKEPENIHCHRAHKIAFNEDGALKPYTEWTKCIQTDELSNLNFFTTGGGVLFPPKSLHKSTLNINLFEQLCPTADDIWFWAMSIMSGTKIRVVNDNLTTLVYINPELEYGLTDKSTLYHKNNQLNDNQLVNIIGYFDDLNNLIDHERK